MLGYIKYLFCSATSHKTEYAGQCPFTGVRYNYCNRCGSNIPLDFVD